MIEKKYLPVKVTLSSKYIIAILFKCVLLEYWGCIIAFFTGISMCCVSVSISKLCSPKRTNFKSFLIQLAAVKIWFDVISVPSQEKRISPDILYANNAIHGCDPISPGFLFVRPQLSVIVGKWLCNCNISRLFLFSFSLIKGQQTWE